MMARTCDEGWADRLESFRLEDWRQPVFRLALSILGRRDSAEDAAQEAMLRLHRSRQKIGRADEPAAWVRRVTVRCCLDSLNRHRRHEPLPERAGGEFEGDVEVRAVLATLSSEHRVILALALGEGLSYAEIGAALGIPEGTVASRLHAAKAAFRKAWEAES